MSDVLTAIVEQLYKDEARIKELEIENAALLAANRDMQLHFDAMRDDLAKAVAERDDQRASMTQHADELYASITQISDQRDQLRERLDAIDAAQGDLP